MDCLIIIPRHAVRLGRGFAGRLRRSGVLLQMRRAALLC